MVALLLLASFFILAAIAGATGFGVADSRDVRWGLTWPSSRDEAGPVRFTP
ncbi:MAG: hypothetical protein JWM76_1663 [Pseudonocardiales bacterium]|nr:hypothetical protein [Pseudonocardiales bacterium]